MYDLFVLLVCNVLAVYLFRIYGMCRDVVMIGYEAFNCLWMNEFQRLYKHFYFKLERTENNPIFADVVCLGLRWLLTSK